MSDTNPSQKTIDNSSEKNTQENLISKSFQSTFQSSQIQKEIIPTLQTSPENYTNNPIIKENSPKKMNTSNNKQEITYHQKSLNSYFNLPKKAINLNEDNDEKNDGDYNISESKNNNNLNNYDIDNEKNVDIEKLFLNKKRLNKRSDILLKNKILRKIAKGYFEKEAELGSDNEEHDDLIKKVYHNDSDIEREEDKNAKDIEGLINNDEKENYIQNEKYFDDMLEKDREEVLQVIEGPKKRIIKEKENKIILDDNNLSLKVRMERMSDMNLLNNEDEEENNFKSLESKLKELKKAYKEDETNEELKNMIEDNNKKLIEEINKLSGASNKEFHKRIEDNKNILKHVIMKDNNKEDNKEKNVVKGNGGIAINNKNFRPFGSGMFKKNSLLNHIKKDKDKGEGLQHRTSFDNNLKLTKKSLMNSTNVGGFNQIFMRNDF